MNLSRQIQRLFCYFVVISCSFEIFLVINIGFNFKASQIALILAAAFFGIEFVNGREKIAAPPAISLILIVVIFSVIFIPNSDLYGRNLGYSLWLIFNVIGILIFFNVFKVLSNFRTLIDVVLLATAFNAIFGLLQFALGVVGLPAPLVTQWWIEGRLPRVNGFNYEPSFFATYLILGWVLSLYLLEKRPLLLNRKLTLLAAISSTIALLVCTSRMGWFAMMLWLIRPAVIATIDLLKKGKLSLGQAKLFSAYFGVLFAVVTGIFSAFSLDELQILIAGLGLVEEGGSFSAEERSSTTLLTAVVAGEHLIAGLGLGGIPAEIARLSGAAINTLDDAKHFEGKNITFELVAGLGVAGAALVYLFLGSTFWRALSYSKKLSASREAEKHFVGVCLDGLVWAIGFEFVLLQLNQNFLRVYTWTYIAVLFAALRVGASMLDEGRIEQSSSKTVYRC